ncbi:MAG: J domain-containing protein [Terracidiphilus sp.]|jgi:DnaJ-domain-containing protein 1
MNGQFQVDRGSCATTPEGYDAIPEIEPNRRRRVWGFVDEFQRLVGADSEPDIRFFMESWTSGTAAAVTSFQQRRQRQPEQDDPIDALHEFDSLDTVSFTHERATHSEFSASVSLPANAKRPGSGKAERFLDAAGAQLQDEAWQEWDSFTEECGSSATHLMTKQFACRLLGVNETSTRKQIRAAYRRMVSQWHPDRLELGTEEMRQMANGRMAAINEAYHLLLSGLR